MSIDTLPDFPLANLGSFRALIHQIQSLPYGRISDRNNPWLVLEEKRGTCSSKHALLAQVAHEHGHPEITLEVGYYVIDQPPYYFPEAHCYLRYQGRVYDFTHATGPTLLKGLEPYKTYSLDPNEISEKEKRHREELTNWCKLHHKDADTTWQMREEFITNLSE